MQNPVSFAKDPGAENETPAEIALAIGKVPNKVLHAARDLVIGLELCQQPIAQLSLELAINKQPKNLASSCRPKNTADSRSPYAPPMNR